VKTKPGDLNLPTVASADSAISYRQVPGGRPLLAIGALLLLIVLGYLAIGSYVAAQLTTIEAKPQTATPADYGLDFEDATIQTRDGLALAGWYIPAAGSDRAVVLVHGHTACRSCEFGDRFVEFAAQLPAAGYSVLMIDMRAHGQSEGGRFTLGDKERWDVLAAVDWLQQRGFDKIAVLGVSLGGAASAGAAAHPDGQSIDALVLDSSFGSVRELVEDRFPEASGLPSLFLPGAFLMGRLLFGLNVDEVRPVDDLPDIPAPVMLMFSTQDQSVPAHQFQDMVDSRPNMEVWTVTDAEHARIYNTHPEEYVARVSRFLDQSLR
jgi:pimeloyl-ACP methyl ester carboxylesterase